MIVHLLDGTYELFRHFYEWGGRAAGGVEESPLGAADVLHTIAQMLAGGATHFSVATDHVIARSRRSRTRST